jgi:hypothetical protein
MNSGTRLRDEETGKISDEVLVGKRSISSFTITNLRRMTNRFQITHFVSSVSNPGRVIQDSLDSSLLWPKLEGVNSEDENQKVDGPHVRIQRRDISQKLHRRIRFLVLI